MRKRRRYKRKPEPIKLEAALDAEPLEVLTTPRMLKAAKGVVLMCVIGLFCVAVAGAFDNQESGRIGRLFGRLDLIGRLAFVFAIAWYVMAYLREASKPSR